jgi:hypothetical protein
MKRAFIFLALLGLTHPLWSADNEIQKVITELEFKWAEAQKLGHAKVVAPMLAEGFFNTDADGQTYGKEKLLSNLKGGQWEQNGVRDVKVMAYGNTAIATGTWEGKGIDGDGTKNRPCGTMDRHVGEDAGREVAMRGQPADFYAEALRRKVTGMVAV